MSLYDADFYEWTREQSAALRRRLSERANTDLDLENLAEEIESLGRSEQQAAESAVARIIEHLLKLELSPADYPRAGWEDSVNEHRSRLILSLEASPSLRRKIRLVVAYALARKRAIRSLARDGVDELSVPLDCPYTLDGIVDDDFWPEQRAANVS